MKGGKKAVLSGAAKIAGVLGWPIVHAQSPRLYSHWLVRYGIDGAVVPLGVRPDRFFDALLILPHMGFVGVTLAAPYKNKALEIVDRLDEEARQIGAVNVVTFDPKRGNIGNNTDAFGFLENLKVNLRGWSPACGPAVILGAGGAARAACAALANAGAPEIRIVNRTRSHAKSLASAIEGPIRAIPWHLRENALDGAALLVNATPQGMTGQPPLDLSLSRLPTGAVVTDMVYVPLRTPLLEAAEGRGNTTIDGLGMLLHQGRRAFSILFGTEPRVTQVDRAFLLRGIGPSKGATERGHDGSG